MKAINSYKGKTATGTEFEVTGNFKPEFLNTDLVFTGWIILNEQKVEIKDGELRSFNVKGEKFDGIRFTWADSPAKNGKATIKITEDMQDFIAKTKKEYGVLKEEHLSHFHSFFVHGWESHEVTIDDRKLEEEAQTIAKYYEVDGITEEHIKKQFNKKIAEEKAYEEKMEKAKTKKKEEEKRINEKYQHIETEILERKTIKGGEGEDYLVTVECKNKNTGETLKFNCRNIFDFGYVINPAYSVIGGIEPGGLRDGDHWNVYRHGNVRELTNFEKDCLDLLKEKPPVFKGVRLC